MKHTIRKQYKFKGHKKNKKQQSNEIMYIILFFQLNYELQKLFFPDQLKKSIKYISSNKTKQIHF